MARPESPDEMETVPDEEGQHPAGVWRALLIVGAAACFAWIPYVVPGIEEMQVVGAHDALPLSGLLSDTPRRGGAELAGAVGRSRMLGADDDALMEATPLPAPILIADQTPPEGTPSEEAAPEGAPPVRIETAEYEGLTREIEDPHGSMRGFYRRLAAVSRGEPLLARVGVYGTSTNGADRMTSQLRRLLQERFGDGGKGWVPVAAGWRFQRHQDVEWSHERWRTFVINRGDAPLHRYGYGGVLAVNRNRAAVARIGTVDDDPGRAVSHFRIFYQAWPEGGDLHIAVDDGAPRIISTQSDEVEDRTEIIDVEDGPHELTLRAVGGDDGEGREDLRLYGVTMERDGPGVVVDGLALIGAFTRVLRLFDEQHLATQVQMREPHLLVFWMGANDAVSEEVAFVPDRYATHYRGILRRFQDANPSMSCMVMSILDKGESVDGRIRTLARVPRVVETQREVALAEGCAFFDAYEAMGGEGTMRRWHQNRPRLVTDDLGHLTAAGSRVMGTLLYRALLKGLDDWIAAGEPGAGE